MIDIYNFIGASVLTSSFTREKQVHRHVPSFGYQAHWSSLKLGYCGRPVYDAPACAAER